MDRHVLGGAVLAMVLVVAGRSTAPGATTTTDIDSRTLSVPVENRDDGDQREVFLTLGLREGEEAIWDDNESLSGIGYKEQSTVLGRDGQFDRVCGLPTPRHSRTRRGRDTQAVLRGGVAPRVLITRSPRPGRPAPRGGASCGVRSAARR